MKLTMNNSEEKGGTANSNKIRIAVFGQHDAGKSALTVRYLTRRYIGEYKSNTDLLYRQTLSISHGTIMEIEIVDITTAEGPDSFERKALPMEEIQRADGFVIVYSITDRSSFNFALEALADINNHYNNSQNTSFDSDNSTSTSTSPNVSPTALTQPKATCPVALIANKNDLEHLRAVEKVEGISASLKYGCQFYELSVAENSPLVYTSFQSIITTLISQSPVAQSQVKRKFSVSKMLSTLRLGRTSPSNAHPIPTAPASITDTNVITSSTNNSTPNSSSAISSPAKSRESSPFSRGKGIHQRQLSGSSSDTSSSCSSSSSNPFSNSLCHLRSKLVELHSMKKRHNSPPICSL